MQTENAGMSLPVPQQLVAAVVGRSTEIADALDAADDAALDAPSALPGWSRLVLVCHLRYGAEALTGITNAALAGRPASYYPGGRAQQRPGTLRPEEGETARAVVESFRRRSQDLDDLWRPLGQDDWAITVREPEGNVDLGPLALGRLLLLRLTEVEVHGTDLDLGLIDWSDTFVRAALPFRLDWLNHRRANPRPSDATIEGSWLLVATDGPSALVTAHGGAVESRPAPPGTAAGATIEGTSRDLLALLLGRPIHEPLRYSGDRDLAGSFERAFPGP